MRPNRMVRSIIAMFLVSVGITIVPIRDQFVETANAATLGTGSCISTVTSTSNVTASTAGSDCVLSFTAGSNSWTPPAAVSNIWVLVVAGGGGGGSRHGGGGGAGAMMEGANYSVSPSTSQSIAVGTGGAGSIAQAGGCGVNGGDSTFGVVLARGGGKACGGPNLTDGGSSGGTNYEESEPGAPTTGSVNGTNVSHTASLNGITAYGTSGAKGWASSCVNVAPVAWCGGGGGGAGSGGVAASTAVPGNGGPGRGSSITGTATTYAAGGGGAYGISVASDCIGRTQSGGLGGSNNVGGSGGGIVAGSGSAAGNGANNTGSGGGGGTFCDGANYVGGSGAAGIVVVRWTPDTTKPSVSTWTPPISPGKNRSISFGLAFTEIISGLESADFSNSGTATGCTFTPSTSSGTSFTIAVTCSSDGTVIPLLAVDAVTDGNYNNGPAATSSSTAVTIDTVVPSALWSSPATLFSSLVYRYTLTISESITNLVAADFSTTGTATGCVVTVSAAAGSSFQVTATCTSPGTVTLRMLSNAVTDSAGNTGPATNTDAAEETIPKLTQATLTVTSTIATYGQPLTLTTSGGNGDGTVTWSVTSGSCTVLNATLTPSDAGSTCEVRATKATDNTYLAAVSLDALINIGKANQSALTVNTTTATYGQPLTLSATGGSGQGLVTWAFRSGTCTILNAVLTPGDAGSVCVVRASRATDTNYNQVNSSDTTITINKTSQAALFVSSTTAVFGQTLTLTTTGGTDTGTVTWQVISGTCTLSGTTLTPGNVGSSCVVRATKESTTNYSAVDSSDTTVTIGKASQSVLAVTSTTATYGQTLSLTTSGGSGAGVVTWQVIAGTCTVSTDTLTPSDANSLCKIRATKAASDNYNSVDSVDEIITINKTSQSTLTVATTTAPHGRTTSLSATGGSGNGTVTWVVTTGTCSVSGVNLTPGNVGSTCVVRATKATDTNYNSINSSTATISITKGSQTGLTITSPDSFTTGTTLLLTATGGQSNGSLSWSATGTYCSLTSSSLSASRGGTTCTVEVTRAGDSNYNSTSETMGISVDKIVQVLTFRSTPPSRPTPNSTYTVDVDSDAFLAPTIAIANASSSVCTISAGVVTFAAIGNCLISASQAGNDTVAAAAASQQVTVVSPTAATTTTTEPAQSIQSTTTQPATSATTAVPQSITTSPTTTTSTTPSNSQNAAQVATTTTTTTSTTTTTTTTIPDVLLDSSSGPGTELNAGETYAIVRGKKVATTVVVIEDTLVVTLPNSVQVVFGPSPTASDSATVSTDGTLRAFTNQTVGITATGMQPDSTYTVVMFSEPTELDRGTIPLNGKYSGSVIVPKDTEISEHTLQVNGVGPNNEVFSLSMGIEVLERQSNTGMTIFVLSIAILLAMLGGRSRSSRRRRAV